MNIVICVTLCIVFAVASKFDQIHLEKLRDNVQLKGAVHFAINGRLECAVACGNKSHRGLLYIEHGRCKCLTDGDIASLEKGTFELWKVQTRSSVHETKGNHSSGQPDGFPREDNSGSFVICDGKVLYWYDNDTSKYEAKHHLRGSLVVDIAYIRSTETLYWVTNSLEGLHSTQLSMGNIGPGKSTMLKGNRIDRFELDIERNEVIWMTVATIERSSLSMGDVEEYEFDPLIERPRLDYMTIDRRNKHIYFGDRNTILRMDYDAKEIKEIRRGRFGPMFYNEADKTLYWEERDEKKRTYSIKSRNQHPPGEINTLVENGEGSVLLHVHNKNIFYKSKSGRDITVMTVNGVKLPAVCTDANLSTSDVSLEFL